MNNKWPGDYYSDGKGSCNDYDSNVGYGNWYSGGGGYEHCCGYGLGHGSGNGGGYGCGEGHGEGEGNGYCALIVNNIVLNTDKT